MPTAVENAISDVLKRQDRIIAATEYSVLGRIAVVHTIHGAMDFGKDGPIIARAVETGDLLMLGSWTPLQAVRISTDEFCQACLSKCDECNGKGQRICARTGCGGAGKIAIGTEDCMRCDGHDKKCSDCHGQGVLTTYKPCDVCKGTGKAACNLCRGTGKRPTGAARGSTSRTAPICAACNGYKREGKVQKQSWTKHAQGLVKDTEFVSIGPIRSLVLHGMGNESGTSMRHITIQPDEHDRLAAILVADPEQRSKAYIVGGVPLLM